MIQRASRWVGLVVAAGATVVAGGIVVSEDHGAR
ncbi:MAG: hypothetical protein QOJ89_3666, partial [bacterium]